MCRYDPVTKTERRCPSYLDRASYNAKRRARYKEKKNGNAFIKPEPKTIETSSQTLMQSNSLPFNTSSHIFGYRLEKTEIVPIEQPETNVAAYSISDEYVSVDSLNVTVREAVGSFVEADYFSRQVFQGQIDYTQLDENSYKTFFKPIEDDFQAKEEARWDGKLVKRALFERKTSKVAESLHDLIKVSEVEIAGITEREVQALNFFSSNNYKWFNAAIYTKGGTLNTEYSSTQNIKELENLQYANETSKNAKAIAKLLDSALAKGPKVQRVLYRGVSENNNMFEGKMPDEWIQSVELGQEMKFDGYQSASQNFDSASGYTNGNGVLFEILTPEGVQISGCSEYSHERETLLPRDTRYQVVGVHKNLINSDNNSYQKLSVVQLVAINSKGEILDGSNSEKPKTLNLTKAQN